MTRAELQLDLLDRHITAGKLSSDHHKNLHDLVAVAEPHHFSEVHDIWRMVTLLPEDYLRLKAGHEITRDGQQHDCWTHDRNSIQDLMREKWDASQAMPMVVMHRRLPTGTKVLDIQKMAQDLNYRDINPTAWHQYAESEKEVIVANPGGTSRIIPDEICEGMIEPLDWVEIFTPRVGESFYYCPDGEMFEIREAPLGFNEGRQAWIIPDEGRFVYVGWERGLICFEPAVDEPVLDIVFADEGLEMELV